MRRLGTWTLIAAAAVTSCDVVSPEEVPIQPALVLAVHPDYQSLLEEVRRIRFEIEVPLSATNELRAISRDTVVIPEMRNGQVRARLSLRPNEGSPGTSITVGLGPLTRVFVPILQGSTVLGEESGWPLEVRLDVTPVADLIVPRPDTLIVGEVISLTDLETLEVATGTVTSSETEWTSSDPSVIEITNGAAVALAPGTSELVASWHEQVDTTFITVFAEGTIEVSPESILRHLEPWEQMSDAFMISPGDVIDIGQISASVGSAYPWLQAVVETRGVRRTLFVDIDGSLLPEGAPPGEIVLSSSREAITDAVVLIQARVDPSTGFEERIWSPFCFVGTSQCVSVRARAWNEYGVRHLTMNVRNLSPVDASAFDLYSARLYTPPMAATIEALRARTSGPVGQLWYPSFTASQGVFQVVQYQWTSGIAGCGPSDTRGVYVTCDDQGYTGSFRGDFQVADTTWSLATFELEMQAHRGAAQWTCREGDGQCELR